MEDKMENEVVIFAGRWGMNPIHAHLLEWVLARQVPAIVG